MKTVEKGKKRLVYLADDNGEVIYHLYILQKLLWRNPELEVVMIPRGGQYGSDASYSDVMQILDRAMFRELKVKLESKNGNFKVLRNSPRLGGIDLLRISQEARDAINTCDLILSSGCINFEMLNGIDKDVYHILMVHGSTTKLSTGYDEGEYLFLHTLPRERYLAFNELDYFDPNDVICDTCNAKALAIDVIWDRLSEDDNYVIEYDGSRLSRSQIEIIKTYADLLDRKHGARIRARGYVSTKRRDGALIKVSCRGRNGYIKGEGRIDVEISEGKIEEYLLRITGMVNIALAVSSIPNNATKEELSGKYGHIIGFIQAQYKLILGRDFVLPSTPDGLQQAMRYILLTLPKVYRRPIEVIEEHNRRAREALISA